MSKRIDADELRNFIKDQYFQCDMPEEWGNGVMWATSQINHYCNKADTPIIEPKRGEWKVRGNPKRNLWECSLCRCTIYSESESDRNEFHKWCGRCGAQMKGADDEID